MDRWAPTRAAANYTTALAVNTLVVYGLPRVVQAGDPIRLAVAAAFYGASLVVIVIFLVVLLIAAWQAERDAVTACELGQHPREDVENVFGPKQMIDEGDRYCTRCGTYFQVVQ